MHVYLYKVSFKKKKYNNLYVFFNYRQILYYIFQCFSLLLSIFIEITEFTDTVQSMVENLQTQGNIIEQYKLKAIGQRNFVETEQELRQQTIREMHALLEEKYTILTRLENEYNSLVAIEQGQKEILEKLSNNEPG